MFTKLKRKLSGLLFRLPDKTSIHEYSSEPESVASLLENGYSFQMSGHYSKAEENYKKILELDAENIDAHYLLGRLNGQLNNPDKAINHLLRAINLKPDFADAYNDLGNVYSMTDNHDLAIENYRKSLELKPAQAIVHLNLGKQLKIKGNLDEASEEFLNAQSIDNNLPESYKEIGLFQVSRGMFKEAAISFKKQLMLLPNDPEGNFHLGTCLMQMKQTVDAIAHFRHSLDTNPSFYEAAINLALALYENKQLDEATNLFHTAIELKYDSVQAHYGLGVIYQDQGALDDAMDSYQLAVHYHPEYEAALFMMGNIEKERNNLVKAQEYYEKAIEINPEFEDAHSNLGSIFQIQYHIEKAIACYQKALSINPEYVLSHNNLGLALREQGQYQKAYECFSKALELKPDFEEARNNQGLIYMDLGDLEKAIQCFDEVLTKKPGDHDASWNKTAAKLLMGDFNTVWEGYERRWKCNYVMQRPFSFPIWQNELLNGHTLLIYGEQGLGDEIMFSSCIPDVIEQSTNLVIECDKRLVPIFQRSFPDIRVHGEKKRADTKWLSDFPDIDIQIPMGSLPLHFRKTWDNFPSHKGYLKADTIRVNYWKQQLEKLGAGIKIGISWKGGTKITRRALRSIDLDLLTPILGINNAHFVNLQYGDIEDDLQILQQKHQLTIHNFPNANTDYDETAALVSALDLVISIQTAVIHLGGALGTPVWVMVPVSPEWRYLRHGEKMPWYPSVRLYRQEEVGNWQPCIHKVANDLLLLIGNEFSQTK